ncbi:MAG TPA: fructosamine kinase family protein [Polyangiaceae bacterium]|jgi:fructosamine-3-kinase|nr:fructosamine kinase family protein [Polyangiaceae bacterium]
MIQPALRSAIERSLGARIESYDSVAGGDINQAFCVELAGGRQVFVKTHASAASGMFEAEATGLEWLREASALRVPEVLAVGSQPSFLALEFLPSRAPSASFDERLGQGLARLHRFGAPAFGFASDNFIGRLPQSNLMHPTWLEFYRDERLLAQLSLARRSGRASRAMERGFERLLANLEDVIGPSEPPARLHGDLWGGNLHIGPVGEPCLIDPAVYGGHREIDLAMMRLFGGFSARVFESYREAYPLLAGHEQRVHLYQLYPLLVHVNHFGGSYVAQVEHALSQIG